MNGLPDLNAIQSNALPNFRFGGGTLGDIVTGVLPYIFFFAGFALLIYFIYGGYQLLTSTGDPKKIAGGKSILTNAIIGFVIIFVSFWVVQLTGIILGLGPILEVF